MLRFARLKGDVSMPRTRATKCHIPLRSAALTVAQSNAVDSLVSGKNDKETAESVGVDRTTVTRWRLYSPEFQAALNVRRAEIWSVGAARIQSLIPKALDVLAAELDNAQSPNRLKAAFELLRLVPPGGPAIGPTDPDEIVRGRVAELRKRTKAERELEKETEEENDSMANYGDPPMPTAKQLTEAVFQEIGTRLQEPPKSEDAHLLTKP